MSLSKSTRLPAVTGAGTGDLSGRTMTHAPAESARCTSRSTYWDHVRLIVPVVGFRGADRATRPTYARLGFSLTGRRRFLKRKRIFMTWQHQTVLGTPNDLTSI